MGGRKGKVETPPAVIIADKLPHLWETKPTRASIEMNDNAMNTEEVTINDEGSRPFKRRKFYRKQAGFPQSDQVTLAETQYSSNTTPNLPSVDDTPTDSPNSGLVTVDDDDDDDEHSSLSVAEILRRRRTSQRKRAGIEFTNATPLPANSVVEPIAGEGLLEKEDSLDKILTVVDRFAPQTGQVADVDKHMYAINNSTILS